MSEETEKKPEFVVHKKQQDSAPAAQTPATPEKKRIVVVKKKPAAAPAKKVVVKKQAPATAGSEKKAEGAAAAKTPVKNENRGHTPFELNPSRPNVKAGNLSDKGRTQNKGGSRSQFGNGQKGGFNRDGANGGGFTGSQARQGYQNRERDGNKDAGFKGGFGNKQGGFNKGGQAGGQRFGGGANGGFRGGRPGMGGAGAAPAMPIDNSRSQGKKAAFKGKKQIYNRKDEEQYDDKFFEQKKKVETPASVVPKSIDIMETISVSDLARKMNLKASEVIGKLMGMGMMVTITQSIDSDTATLLAAEYGCEVHLVSL